MAPGLDGGTGGRGDGGGDVPLCDLGHQRRARSPARTHNAKSISIIVHVGPFIAGGPRWNKMKGATYHGSSLVASRTLASISLTLSTTFLAYRSPHKGRPSSSAITLGLASNEAMEERNTKHGTKTRRGEGKGETQRSKGRGGAGGVAVRREAGRGRGDAPGCTCS